MQLQCRISRCIGNAILSKSGPSARIMTLFGGAVDGIGLSFNNEAADHHVVTSLAKARVLMLVSVGSVTVVAAVAITR